MNVAIRLRRGNTTSVFSEKELQREYCCIGNQCRSRFGKELTGTTFEGGVLNISPLTVQLQVQYANA